MRATYFLLALLLVVSCSKKNPQPPLAATLNEKHITILSTNDIHGGVEPTLAKNGKSTYGGMALVAGAFSAIREGLKKKYGADGAVIAVDGGDQFQGTLISNYDEGQLVFATMNEVGYDAVVPGNHDYDFGPIGWLVDSADPKKPNEYRQALDRIVKQAKFPLVSGNTFLKDTLVDNSGKKVVVDNRRCKHAGDAKIDWAKAKRPDFLKPYVLKEAAGVRVALIGIDHPNTPETTTAVNVSDLCFGDEYEHYMLLRTELASKADIFILVMHNGDADTDKAGTQLLQKLSKVEGAVHAVVSAHTHFTYNNKVDGIPLIQSGHGGTSFGRIDLVWDAVTKKLVPGKTKSYAGVMLFADGCDERSGGKDFCKVDEQKRVTYEGERLVKNPRVLDLIVAARKVIDPMAKQKLGIAKKDITRDRINESPLANEMTDLFLEVSKAQVATLNTGGLRDIIKAGDITYEDLFAVLPFANHGVVVSPMPRANLVGLLQKSIKTCGIYGALMQAGLRVTYKRDCKDAIKHGGLDPNAQLLRVEMKDGTLVWDHTSGENNGSPAEYTVATLDFLARGGDNYEGFKGVPQVQDLDIIRETMKDHMLKRMDASDPVTFKGDTDQRWKNETP